jgi:hypothetical protein
LIRKTTVVQFSLLVFVLLCTGAHAASSSTPSYTATLKLGKGNVATGSTLTIQGKAFDLYSLFNLSTIATPKGGAPYTMNEQIDVFTSNGNARLVFFSTSGTSTITTNGNVNPFSISYTVKVTKSSTTAKSSKSKTISFSAVSGAASKSKFKFVFSGTQVDTAVAGLPKVTKGKNSIPALGDAKAGTGVTNFTVQFGSATFVGHFSKGKIVFP